MSSDTLAPEHLREALAFRNLTLGNPSIPQIRTIDRRFSDLEPHALALIPLL